MALYFRLLKNQVAIRLSLSKNIKSSSTRHRRADILLLLHCEMIIGFFCFSDVGLLALFLVTWAEIYTAGDGVHFSSLLNAAILFFLSVRPSRQLRRSFESCIIYNSDLDETPWKLSV